MNDLNGKIRQALTEEGFDPRDLEREQTIFQMLFETFRGQQRYVNILGAIFQLIFMALTVWAAMRFFDASQAREQILFSTLFITSFGVTMSFKIWFWMVMNRNALSREIKRLELQVARLAGNVGDRKD